MDTNNTQRYAWIDSDGKGGWKVLSGRGQRFIVFEVQMVGCQKVIRC